MTFQTDLAPRAKEHVYPQKVRPKSAKAGQPRGRNPSYIGGATSPPATPARRLKTPRLHRDRESSFLTLAQARNLMEAAAYAETIGKPLNRFTTIHWQAADITDDYQDATLRFLKLAADWLRLRGEALAYVWVRETGAGKGEHVHILMHVPPHLARPFSNRQRGWLRACGANFRKGVINSRAVGRNYCHALKGVQYGEHYRDHLSAALAYVCKGASGEARKILALPKAEFTGTLRGKRCATSQNIGRGARDKCHSSGPVRIGRNGRARKRPCAISQRI